MRLLLAAALLGFPAAAVAQDTPLINGAAFQKMCNGDQGPSGETACLFYVVGIGNGLEYGSMFAVAAIEGYQGFDVTYPRSQQLLGICVPGTATNEQIVLVVEKFLADHPERLHEDIKMLVPSALREAFPCAQ